MKVQWQIEDVVRDIVETHPETASTLFHYKTSTSPNLPLLLSLSLSFTLSLSITVLLLSSIFHRRPSTIDHQFTSNHPPLFTLFTPTLSHDVSAPGSTSRPRKPSGSPDIRMLVLSNQLDWIFWPPLPPRRRSLCQARSYSHPRL